MNVLFLRPGEGGQGYSPGGGPAPEAGQHATAGGESDFCRTAQEIHRVVLSQHRQETLTETLSAQRERER